MERGTYLEIRTEQKIRLIMIQGKISKFRRSFQGLNTSSLFKQTIRNIQKIQRKSKVSKSKNKKINQI
jgi:hypothetical protein